MPRRSNRTPTPVAAGITTTGGTKGGDTPTVDPTNEDGEGTTSLGEQQLSSANNILKGVADTTSPKTKKNKKNEEVASKSGIPTNQKTAAPLPIEKVIAPKKKRKTQSLASSVANNEQATNNAATSNDTDELVPQPAIKKKAKAPAHQQWTERTPLAKLWDTQQQHAAQSATGSYTFSILSWNVAGLRALIKNHPDTLRNLVRQYNVDVLCLQETKLQEGHMDDAKLKLKEYFDEKLGEYDGYFSYSLEKKGYSGTAMFIKRRSGGGGGRGEAVVGEGGDDGESGSKTKKKKQQATLGVLFAPTKKDKDEGKSSTGDTPLSHLRPIKVETTLGLPAHDGEGRTITAEFPLFHLTNVYVPNSGQQLDRLSYRTQQWDTDFLAKMQHLETDTKKPIVWLGDLNVAHNEKDTWNEGAKHLAKSAGTTAEERVSFSQQLEAGFVDAFRRLHPEGRGHYTYWSQRAGNRAPNKGLRLDYFICSKELMEDNDADNDASGRVRVRDCYMLPEIMGSDHCPIVLVSVSLCVDRFTFLVPIR